jgi:hypothetical protein
VPLAIPGASAWRGQSIPVIVSAVSGPVHRAAASTRGAIAAAAAMALGVPDAAAIGFETAPLVPQLPAVVAIGLRGAAP